MVGKTGFEPATPWSQTKCSTKLSHFPSMVRSEGFEPPTFWFVAKHSIQLSYERKKACSTTKNIKQKKWWLQRESNQRHRDFQSLALPTELWSQIMAVPTGLEPAIFCVTGKRVNQLHQGTKWLREEDSNLWPSGYEPNELPNCSIPRYQWRRKRDSNPCAACTTFRFSRPVPSTRLGYSSTNLLSINNR